MNDLISQLDWNETWITYAPEPFTLCLARWESEIIDELTYYEELIWLGEDIGWGQIAPDGTVEVLYTNYEDVSVWAVLEENYKL